MMVSLQRDAAFVTLSFLILSIL
uniref:Uncharacterized protein n=1 Tax=Rhizophora mucronata TaxID=61149 RepID=A0A2P2QD49_RHIMU